MRFIIALAAGALLFSGPLLAQEVSGNFGGGSVLHGYDSGTCNAAREGALHFNSTTNAWGYCDGANWAFANSTLLTAGPNGGVGASSTVYAGFGFTALNATERNMIVPAAGTISRLYLRTFTAQPASGTMVCNLRKNAGNTALQATVPISGAAGNYTDTANSVTVVAGDSISVRCINNATGVSASMDSISVMFAF